MEHLGTTALVLRYLIQHTAHMRQLSNIVKTVGPHLSTLSWVGQHHEPPETDGCISYCIIFNCNFHCQWYNMIQPSVSYSMFIMLYHIQFLLSNIVKRNFGQLALARSRLWFHSHSGSFIHCFSADCCRQSYSGCSDSFGPFPDGQL